VDPVPDSPLLRKSGSAGNRTRDLWVCSQEHLSQEYKFKDYLHSYVYVSYATTPVGLDDNHPGFCWATFFLHLKSLLLVTFSGLRPSDPRACNMWSIRCSYLPLHAIDEYSYPPAIKLACYRSVQTDSGPFHDVVWTTEIVSCRIGCCREVQNET
jgi:hypothetical protein